MRVIMIDQDSQDQLEKEIRAEFSKLGFKLFAISSNEVNEPYHLAIEINKKFIEYFDNARLLRNTKENTNGQRTEPTVF